MLKGLKLILLGRQECRLISALVRPRWALVCSDYINVQASDLDELYCGVLFLSPGHICLQPHFLLSDRSYSLLIDATAASQSCELWMLWSTDYPCTVPQCQMSSTGLKPLVPSELPAKIHQGAGNTPEVLVQLQIHDASVAFDHISTTLCLDWDLVTVRALWVPWTHCHVQESSLQWFDTWHNVLLQAIITGPVRCGHKELDVVCYSTCCGV